MSVSQINILFCELAFQGLCAGPNEARRSMSMKRKDTMNSGCVQIVVSPENPEE